MMAVVILAVMAEVIVVVDLVAGAGDSKLSLHPLTLTINCQGAPQR
jgi:hypothetical protein